MRRALVAFVVVTVAVVGAVQSGAQSYVTTAGELAALAGQYDPAQPVAVAVGAGHKAAPLALALRLMSPDGRAAWWDAHKDAGCDKTGACAAVLVLAESTRAQAVAPAEPYDLADHAARGREPGRYLVAVAALQLRACQTGERVPCYTVVQVDFVRATHAAARALAQQIALEGCWRGSQYLPAHLVQTVSVSEAGL